MITYAPQQKTRNAPGRGPRCVDDLANLMASRVTQDARAGVETAGIR